jgi:uncharacterized protein
MSKINSETKLLLDLIIGILKSPFILILALFGKRKLREATKPLKEFTNGLLEPKATVYICLSLIITFVLSFVFFNYFEVFVLYPSDFLSARFFSLITHGFLHANISHLLSNLLIIYVFGRLVEKEFGSKKLVATYFFGLVFAGLFASVINLTQGTNVGSVGASGAAMALVAAGTLFRPFSLSFIALIPLPVFVIGWLAVLSDITGVLNASNDGIGYFAHIGGFLSTIILFSLLKETKELKKGILINLILILAYLIYIIYF